MWCAGNVRQKQSPWFNRELPLTAGLAGAGSTVARAFAVTRALGVETLVDVETTTRDGEDTVWAIARASATMADAPAAVAAIRSPCMASTT